jgi:hypothetical protein
MTGAQENGMSIFVMLSSSGMIVTQWSVISMTSPDIEAGERES